MIRHLSITLDNQHGALLRLLGTVERRGWIVKAIDMASHDNDGKRIELMIERSPCHLGSCDSLLRHIARLFCVRDVEKIKTPLRGCTTPKAQADKTGHDPSLTAGATA